MFCYLLGFLNFMAEFSKSFIIFFGAGDEDEDEDEDEGGVSESVCFL